MPLPVAFDGFVELLNLENYTDKLARTDLELQFVFATRDTVVLPELSRQLTASLKTAGVAPGILELNCGHYSLSLPPNGQQHTADGLPPIGAG
jgi:hypothetical protein